MSVSSFELGDHVLIVYDTRRKWLKKIEDKDFHCNFGFIKLGDIVGKRYGSSIETNKGKYLKLYSPTLIDQISFFKHSSQIIYAKDAGSIILSLDVKPGDTIYEAGTGSGALTSILARYVGSEGKIITHENREHAYKTAQKNLTNLGITNVEFNFIDVINDGFVEGKADSLFLDLGNPWEVLPKASTILKDGARVVIFIPTYNQLELTFETLRSNGYKEITASELVERDIQMKSGAIRPSTRMIGFTGYLMKAIFLWK